MRRSFCKNCGEKTSQSPVTTCRFCGTHQVLFNADAIGFRSLRATLEDSDLDQHRLSAAREWSKFGAGRRLSAGQIRQILKIFVTDEHRIKAAKVLVPLSTHLDPLLLAADVFCTADGKRRFEEIVTREATDSSYGDLEGPNERSYYFHSKSNGLTLTSLGFAMIVSFLVWSIFLSLGGG